MNRGLLLAILIIVGVTVVGLGSWEIYQTSQPGVVVHCANAPRKPLTNWPDAILFRPATLVTAQDYFAWGDY